MVLINENKFMKIHGLRLLLMEEKNGVIVVGLSNKIAF